MKKKVIAIDGPAGAGKSTVAQIIARKLAYIYIDTGAMYRAVTWLVISQGIDVSEQDSIIEVAKSINLDLVCIDNHTSVAVNGTDITEEIRTPEVSRLVPEIAKIPAIRETMLYLQRQMAEQGGVVMDGRDIGTHVLPCADCKIFLTASIEARANRRMQELITKGYQVDFDQLKSELAARDRMDSEREVAPLKQAQDAVLVDTTGLTVEQVVEKIIEICGGELTCID